MNPHSKGPWLNFEKNMDDESQKQSHRQHMPLQSEHGRRTIEEALRFFRKIKNTHKEVNAFMYFFFFSLSLFSLSGKLYMHPMDFESMISLNGTC